MTENREPTQVTPSVWTAPDVVLNADDERGQPLKLRPISLGAAALLVIEQHSRDGLQWVAEGLLEIQPDLTDVSFNLSFESAIGDDGYPRTSWYCELSEHQLNSAVETHSGDRDKTEIAEQLQIFFDHMNENIDGVVLMYWLQSCEEEGVVTFNLQEAIANNVIQPKLYIAAAD